MIGIGEKQTLARQVVPLATVAPVPRIDYVAPPGVAIYDVPTTYGGTSRWRRRAGSRSKRSIRGVTALLAQVWAAQACHGSLTRETYIGVTRLPLITF